VQNLDLAPTFLEAAGVAVPDDMQGKSLVPLLSGDGPAAGSFRDAVYYRFEESKGSHTVPRHEGVATADAKLIRYLDLKAPDGSPLVELYDLSRDPAERENLAGRADRADLERRMRAELERVRQAYGAP